MNRIFIGIILFLFSFSSLYASSLSSKDIQAIESAKKIIQQTSNIKDKIWLENRIKKFSKLSISYKNNLRYWLILEALKQEFIRIYEEKYPKVDTYKKEFFEKYGQEITTELTLKETCKKHYDFVDTIAKEHDFPTALIIATWGIETNCGMYSPNNGWGPFQIKSQYYTPGDISISQLEEAIIGFINFSRNKWNYFNTNKYHNLKERFGSEPLILSYNTYTLRNLQLHSILFNGVSEDTTLTGNSFANNNLNPSVTGESDGVVTRFLKVLYWETNKYYN